MIDVRQRENIFNIPAHEKKVSSVCVDEEAGTLISGSADGTVKIWDIAGILGIMGCVIEDPSCFDAGLISKVVNTGAESKGGPAVMQVEAKRGSIWIGDVEGVRTQQKK